jgi:hypothetical protein
MNNTDHTQKIRGWAQVLAKGKQLLVVLFLWAIVLAVIRFTVSDYPFGILKLVLYQYISPTLYE